MSSIPLEINAYSVLVNLNLTGAKMSNEIQNIAAPFVLD